MNLEFIILYEYVFDKFGIYTCDQRTLEFYSIYIVKYLYFFFCIYYLHELPHTLRLCIRKLFVRLICQRLLENNKCLGLGM